MFPVGESGFSFLRLPHKMLIFTHRSIYLQRLSSIMTHYAYEAFRNEGGDLSLSSSLILTWTLRIILSIKSRQNSPAALITEILWKFSPRIQINSSLKFNFNVKKCRCISSGFRKIKPACKANYCPKFHSYPSWGCGVYVSVAAQRKRSGQMLF